MILATLSGSVAGTISRRLRPRFPTDCEPHSSSKDPHTVRHRCPVLLTSFCMSFRLLLDTTATFSRYSNCARNQPRWHHQRRSFCFVLFVQEGNGWRSRGWRPATNNMAREDAGARAQSDDDFDFFGRNTHTSHLFLLPTNQHYTPPILDSGRRASAENELED